MKIDYDQKIKDNLKEINNLKKLKKFCQIRLKKIKIYLNLFKKIEYKKYKKIKMTSNSNQNTI